MVAALALAACDPGSTTPASGSISTPGSTTTTATTAPAAEPSTTASAAATDAGPSSAAEACPVAPQTGRLPSNRLVDIEFPPATGADAITFVFGDDSLPGPLSAPEGTLETAEPPFIQGGSGEPLEVEGEHVALVRFAGMSVANDVGQPVYQGELEFRPELPALRHVVNMEMFEGVVGWYIGYDGPGCLTLEQDGRSVSIVIQHPAG
jgi:hypothetical protein